MYATRAFQLAKSGNAPDECQDAWATDPARGVFVVADGVTGASWSREWAHLLAGAAATSTELDHIIDPERLAEARRQWHDLVPWAELGFFPLEKAKLGGAATLTRLQLHFGCCPEDPQDRGRWSLTQVGDSAMFLVSGSGTLKWAWPPSPSHFSLSTEAIISIERLQPPALQVDGLFESTDYFVLATDAVAVQLHRLEADAIPPWRWVRWLAGSTDEQARSSFEQWVGRHRRIDQAAWRMTNDDVTLLIVDPSTDSVAPIWADAVERPPRVQVAPVEPVEAAVAAVVGDNGGPASPVVVGVAESAATEVLPEDGVTSVQRSGDSAPEMDLRLQSLLVAEAETPAAPADSRLLPDQPSIETPADKSAEGGELQPAGAQASDAAPRKAETPRRSHLFSRLFRRG